MAKIKYIAVAGNIGCGKSTLVEFLRRRYKLRPFFEPNADNPYLKDFYQDMRGYAFQSQIYFLAHKFRMQQALEKRSRRVTVVQDRTIYEDAEVFAAYLHRRRCITKRDWGVYQALYAAILESLRPPDLLIYLRADVRTLRRRIKKRGRPEEQDIPATYIRRLNDLYEEWFASYDRSRTLVIETGRMNYLEDLEHLIELKTEIAKFI